MPSTDTHKAEIVTAPPPKYLANIPVITDPEQITIATLERTMAAETAEELFADPDSGSLRDLVGQIITITDVLGILPSAYGEGRYYIVFTATEADGKAPITLSTGSPYAASRIAAAKAKGFLPRRVRVIELESASNPGQASLWVTDAQRSVGAGTPEEF